ncbi:MAG: hypothetical protein LBC02_08495 [Planctomycetaceae bacterium]|jgi:phenylacetate-coenzyme A ligase PaaK-like adenylate-forming protein|nr:hypothetical protein [Planctomycetaceae bacterium]
MLDFLTAIQEVTAAQTMSVPQVWELQKQRLQTLLEHARSHSPYLKEKYAGLPDNPDLKEIPYSSRDELMQNFDRWVCDSEITFTSATEFIANIANLTKPYLGRYKILATSGTTGMPVITVRDAQHNAVNAALMKVRFWGSEKFRHIQRLESQDLRVVGIVAGTYFHSSYLSYQEIKKVYDARGLSDHLLCLTAQEPVAEMIQKLNAFRPEVLTGFPSFVYLLAQAQKNGELNIAPLAICCSAEQLPDMMRDVIEDAFNAPVMDNYCSTELGEAAMLQGDNKFHANIDWHIIEPVDDNKNPVPFGVQGSGALVTNLANFVQPIIRYYISDKITIHDKPANNSPLPVIEIEGRKEDILEFCKNGKKLTVAPMSLLAIAIHINGCAATQFIQRKDNLLEIRFSSVSPDLNEQIGKELLAKIQKFLAENHADFIRTVLSTEPLQRGKTGKMKYIFRDV